MTEREKAEDVLTQFLWMKNKIFSDTSQQASKNAKTGETIFQDTENKTKQEKM